MSYVINAIEVSNDHIGFEVMLNGGRLIRVTNEPEGEWAQKGNVLLVPGDNELVVAVCPPDGAEAVDPRARFGLKMFEGAHGKHPGEAGKVHEFVWDQATRPVSAGGFREIHRKMFKSTAGVNRWAWLDAIPYNPADDSAILQHVTAVHAALSAKDLNGYLALNATRDAELATALDVPVRKIQQSDVDTLGVFMGLDDWTVDMSPSMEFHPGARGKLVEVTGPNKSAPIVANAEGREIAFPLTYTHLPNVGWTLIR